MPGTVYENMILVDTSAVIALQDPSEQFHDALCASVMKREGIYRVFTFDKHFWSFGFEVLPGATQ